MELVSMNRFSQEREKYTFNQTGRNSLKNGFPKQSPKTQILKNNLQYADGYYANVYYASENMSMEISNKDGDSYSINIEHAVYLNRMTVIGGASDSSQWKEIVECIKNEYQILHDSMVKDILSSIHESGEPQKISEPIHLNGLPPYWNAENTSQRIVDFATSFYGNAECTGNEYFDMVKSAIQDGFDQAMKIIGELPPEVSDVTQATYELTIEKLELWAHDEGIDPGMHETL